MNDEENNEISEINNQEKSSKIKEKEDKILNSSEKNTLKNSDSWGGDIITKINKEANDLENEINSSNLKVFEKYHNLSIKELKILLMQKNDNILNLNEQKEKYKKTLNEIVQKLNLTISKNSDILYNENVDEDLLINLERTKEEKIKELETSKKINKLYKNQLESIKDKLSIGDKEKNKMNSIEIKINNLKKKNSSIKKEINDIRIDKLKHKKEYDIYLDNKKFWRKIKIKTEEMNNFSGQKQGYFNKLNLSMKSLDNVIFEIKRLEENYNSLTNSGEIEESSLKKINYWMNILKKDLTGEKEEILSRIENDQSIFLKKMTNNKNDLLIEKCNTNPANINLTNNDENIINNLDTENANMNNNNNSLINNNNEIQSKLFKNRIMINKNKSTSLILSNLTKGGGNSTSKKSDQIKFYMMKNNTNTSQNTNGGNFNYNLEYKTLFRKLNYLKLKTPLGGSMKLKLNNINNTNNLDSNFINQSNNYISEEINSTSNKIEVNSEILLNNILTKDYNEITNADYRELLVKKEQYLQQNLRLEKNIEDIQKTKNKKLNNVSRVIEENVYNLSHLKNTNDLLKKEIKNLNNLEKLRFEQAKLESEINIKKPNIKKIKLKLEQNKNEEMNKLVEINDYYKNKLKEKKSNKIDYFDEIFKNKNKSNKLPNKKKEINENQNREEKLKIIKEKYKKDNFDDSLDTTKKNKDIEKLENNFNDNQTTEIKENINYTSVNDNQVIEDKENYNEKLEIENDNI